MGIVKGKSSQEFVPIKDIRDGIIILNDGSLRAILMTSSLNFGLKSAEEQAAIIIQFQNFLNSLEFPIQISVQSKRLDIRPYLQMLKEREKVQVIDAMKIQVHEYIEFIKRFTDQSNIMSKSFFVTVPYSGARVKTMKSGGGGLWGILGGKGEKKEEKGESPSVDLGFEESRVQLEQRVSIVEQGLSRCDLRTTRLGTEEVTELFYRKFNPGEFDISVAN
jgi:type IV secretory pathway VirB4 component